MEESDCFSLIDENDSLISPDADDDVLLTHIHSEPEQIEAIGDISAGRVDDMDLSSKPSGRLPQLVATAEPNVPRKTGKFNLRKSLAWDRAFFESPGFLDAEEISTMIDGAEKGKMHLLPGIDEDVSRSTESISTLASENLALEGLEDELFKDIRASIQKSSRASSISTSNRKAAPKDTDKLVKCSVKKVDMTSRNGSATNATSKRQIGEMQGSGRILKKDSSSALVTQAGLPNRKSSSSLSQSLKVITKPEGMPAVTTKRTFLGASRIKTETNKTEVGGKGVQLHVPMAAGLAGPRRSVPKPASLPKASGSFSSGATVKEVGRASCLSNGSNSTLTEKIQKSTSTSARTKTISKPVIQASSKIPLSKKAPGKSGLPSSLTSSKISLSISPSSSISEWSSSSSSKSNVNRLTSRTSIDSNSSCRSMDSETPSILCSDVQSNDGVSDVILNQFKESPSQDIKKTNTQNNALSRSALMKPSGLRMPSPKIGFFDGSKSMVHTPNACKQSQLRLPTGLPKIGAAIRSPVGRSKITEGNVPSRKKVISGANTVLNTLKSASPGPSQESSKAPMKGHGESRSVLSPNISSEVRSSNKGTGKPSPEVALTSTNIELEVQKSGSPKSLQESDSPGRSPEQSQSHLPTGFPITKAAIHSPIGSLKKTEVNILAGNKATAGENTVLDTSNFAAPKPSQESSSASRKGHGGRRSSLSPNISSEVRSSNEGTGKLCSKMTLTSTNTELEGQKCDSIKLFQESASVGLSPEKSQSCLPTGMANIEALIINPIGSSEKEGNIPTGEKATAVAIAVLDASKSASPKPSQESSMVLMKCRESYISSEMRSSNKGTGKLWPEMTLTSTNIEHEGQKSGSPKLFQESACPGASQEQSQSHLPTCLPKTGAAIYSPVRSSNKAEGKVPAGKKTTDGANTVLDTSESGTPEPSQESSRDSVKDHGDHRSLLSPDISSEMMSSDEVTIKPCSEMTLTSIKIEPDGQKADSPKPFQESASFGMSPERKVCQPTGLPNIGAAIHSPVGSSKKADGKISAGKKTTDGANILLDPSESATPEPSRNSMKDHGDHMSLLSLDISSEVTSSDEVSRKPCSEMTLTSTKIELEGQKADSPKPFQESASFGMSPERQLYLPTGFLNIGAAINSPVGSSKKAEGKIPAGKKTTDGANILLDPSESATPEPSQESSRNSMKDHGDHRSLLSLDISSEVTSSDEVSRKPCSEMTLTSTKIELEGQKADSPKPFQESASFGMSPERQLYLPTGFLNIGAAINSPVGSSKKAEGKIPAGKKTTDGANTVLDPSESATPEPSQESSRVSMKDHGDHRSLLSLKSPDISSEVTSSDEASRKPFSGMTLTSTKIELEGQKADSPKPFQESVSFGMSPKRQLYQPTGFLNTGAAIHRPVGSSKKEEGKIPAGNKTAEGANTVLGKSESATPEPSQESSRDSMKGHGDHRSLLSLDILSEVTSSDELLRKPCSEMTLISTNIELECQKFDSPKPFQEFASFGMSPEHELCLITGLPKIGAAIYSPVKSSKKAEGEIQVGNKTTEGANTVLDKSEPATPEPSQESSGDSMMDHGDHKSLLSLDISSEVTSSNEVTGNLCLEMTSANIELEGQKYNSPKSSQDGTSSEHQACLPTGLPKIGAAICNPVESLKKDEEIPAGEKATVGATVLDTATSASPKPSQELLRASVIGYGDPWNLSPDMSSDAKSSNMGSGKLWSKITLTSTDIEVEGQKSDFPKPLRESASPGVSPGILSEIDGSNCIKAEDVKIGKHDSAEWATTNVPEAENDENLLLNI